MKSKARQGAREAYPSPDAPPEPEGAGVASAMPYPVTLVHDADESEWVATIDALPGCTARARTPNEALDRASEAMDDWLETAKREGKGVPEPKTAQSHSGRLLLRMPQTLHAELSRVAERENVSLNQFITDALAGALGWRAPARRSQVTRAVPGLEGDGAADGVLPGDPGSSPGRSHGSAVFVANFVVVALAALVAIAVLIYAVWQP